jgi:uncharacterized Ntn-hydrolase superfamily protein
MTFSIAARCPRTEQLGVGAVTGTPGVGQLVTWAHPRSGAVATQGWVNPYLGIDALDLLANGHPADRAMRAALELDERRELRQVGIVDAKGRSAAFTGEDSEGWANHRTGEGWSAQGNLLEGEEVLEACVEAFLAEPERELADRLMAALDAGEAAGGDRRGAKSAAIYVVAAESYPLWDLRVDFSEKPLEELHRVRDRTAETVIPQIRRLPGRMGVGDVGPDDRAGLV